MTAEFQLSDAVVKAKGMNIEIWGVLTVFDRPIISPWLNGFYTCHVDIQSCSLK